MAEDDFAREGDRERLWRREALAVQMAALAERVRQLETTLHEVERRVMSEADLREKRQEKALVETQTRIEAAIARTLIDMTAGLADRVRVDDFRPYRLIVWILGGAVLVAAIPTLSQTLLPALLKALFHW